MKQLFSIAKFTVKENISNKIFNGFVFFGILVIFTTVVLGNYSLFLTSYFYVLLSLANC